MSLKRYFDKEWRVEDIEKRGGLFIRRALLERSIFGNVVEGTLIFGDGNTADVLVKCYPAGGMSILGPAKRTIEGLQGYNNLIDTFNALEKDKEYAAHATKRQVLAGTFNLILYAMMGVMLIHIVRMDLSRPVQEFMVLGAELAIWFIVYITALVSRRV